MRLCTPICAKNVPGFAIWRMLLMVEPILPDPEFVQEVRSALAHLFDYAYLQNHPLAYSLANGQKFDDVTRAQHLRRTLLDCIESLRPQTQTARMTHEPMPCWHIAV
jgi:hypothetical protein